MGTSFRFIEEPSGVSEVLGWFRSLPVPPTEQPTADGLVLYFRELGPLVHDERGQVDPKRCPVVNLYLPRVRRGVLWTVGEVHFLATPLRSAFPELHRIGRSLADWLGTRECVFTRTSADNPYDYYLEGSVRNFDCPIHAFPSGLAALRRGQYFVASRDNESRLDGVCRALRLRGIQCGSD